MIKFEARSDPNKNLTLLTAYLDNIVFIESGKHFVQEVLSQLVKKLLILKTSDLETLIDNYITSKECREYIDNKIKETINKTIEKQINEMFEDKK